MISLKPVQIFRMALSLRTRLKSRGQVQRDGRQVPLLFLSLKTDNFIQNLIILERLRIVHIHDAIVGRGIF